MTILKISDFKRPINFEWAKNIDSGKRLTLCKISRRLVCQMTEKKLNRKKLYFNFATSANGLRTDSAFDISALKYFPVSALNVLGMGEPKRENTRGLRPGWWPCYFIWFNWLHIRFMGGVETFSRVSFEYCHYSKSVIYCLKSLIVPFSHSLIWLEQFLFQNDFQEKKKKQVKNSLGF